MLLAMQRRWASTMLFSPTLLSGLPGSRSTTCIGPIRQPRLIISPLLPHSYPRSRSIYAAFHNRERTLGHACSMYSNGHTSNNSSVPSLLAQIYRTSAEGSLPAHGKHLTTRLMSYLDLRMMVATI